MYIDKLLEARGGDGRWHKREGGNDGMLAVVMVEVEGHGRPEE